MNKYGKRLLILGIALFAMNFFITNNAFALQINPNVELDNSQTDYITGAAIAVSSFEIDPNHIFLGTRYFDLNSTSGKVFATIQSFSENNDITIQMTNSTFTDTRMFVLTNQVLQVKIDGTSYALNSRWKYDDANTITEIDVNNGQTIFVSFNSPPPPPPPVGGGSGAESANFGGIPIPPTPSFCDLNPNDPSCSITEPLPSYIDLTVTANPINANLGQTIKTSLEAKWTFPSDLLVNSMGASQYGTWVTFPTQPFTLKLPHSGQADYTIPLVINVPSTVCSKSVKDNCVTPDSTFYIPIKINGQYYNAKFGYTTYIPVHIQKLAMTSQNILLIIIGLIGTVIFIGAASQREPRRGQREGTFVKNLQRR